jgi:hypothetical protein
MTSDPGYRSVDEREINTIAPNCQRPVTSFLNSIEVVQLLLCGVGTIWSRSRGRIFKQLSRCWWMVDSTKNGCRKEPEGSDDLTFSQHIESPVDCEKNITTSFKKKKGREPRAATLHRVNWCDALIGRTNGNKQSSWACWNVTTLSTSRLEAVGNRTRKTSHFFNAWNKIVGQYDHRDINAISPPLATGNGKV